VAIVCLDYGERYIGVAITDPDEKIALRHSVIDQKKQAALDTVRGIVEQERVKKVLVGVPVSLSGNETEQTRVSLAFMEKLREALGSDVSVEHVDETLTSVEAEKIVRFEGGNKDDAHAEAARLMLEQYLRSR
jgi:putative Holliday junction resolvase